MSLLNDALKRAKQAQANQPASSMASAPLHPTQVNRRSSPWPRSLLMVAVLLTAAGIFFWALNSGKRTPTEKTATSGLKPAAPVTMPARATTGQNVALPAAVEKAVAATERPTRADAPPPAIPSAPASTSAAPSALLSGADSKMTLPAGAPAPPVTLVSPPLKLQGIIYRQKNPAAIIDGKMLSVGDRINEARIVAIRLESVAVAWNGQTNVLTLP